MVLSLTHLEGIFTVPERFVHPDHRLGAGRYLSRGFIECNREEFAFVVIVNRLDERIGVLEDRKAIAGDVNLPTSSVSSMYSFFLHWRTSICLEFQKPVARAWSPEAGLPGSTARILR